MFTKKNIITVVVVVVIVVIIFVVVVVAVVADGTHNCRVSTLIWPLQDPTLFCEDLSPVV